MALFNSPKIFPTRQKIKEALLKISSLDYRERDTVYRALSQELDDGGVSTEEIKRVVRELRHQKEISEIDRKNLLALLDK
jgi:Mg2+/Co2+ transporter CorB